MRFAAALTLALPAIVAATAIPRQSGNCNTGALQCCNQVQQADSQTANLLSGLLGIALGSLQLPIGLSCSPLDILGVGGNSCSAQPACCSGNTFGGLISLGCNPINLNL
ncbi:hypothetical protein D9756_005702 [Leucocoprinus leucothites]|uniref:Hydrophobin n=1 Tax=Leucocoprinus leucothites TaxID=201217 RepID=A0A8H5FZD4_9AGAR|nr:hypothetical protein D9756_005702 [Leucoagaricus leucothites]